MASLDTTSPFRGQSLVGQKFNRMMVTKYAGKNQRGDIFWESLCDCGNVKIVSGHNLKRGNTKSCGCLNREQTLATVPPEEQELAFWANVEKTPSGCWEWKGGLTAQGYGKAWYDGAQVLAHRLAWFFSHGSWPNQPYVCHRCDNRKCVNFHHFFEGTALDNNEDAINKERMRHWGRPKITPERVLEIRKMYETGNFTYTSLAAHFSLPRTQIHSALRKWKTLPLYATLKK
jgi:hypothetical protein